MKKLALVVLPGLVLLGGSLGLFSGKSTEAKLSSSLPDINNAKSMDLKTGMVAPDKIGVPDKEAIIAKAASIAVPFVKNVGRFNAEVKFAADLFSGRFFLTNKELVYSLLKRSGKENARQDKHKPNAEPEKSMPGKGLAFREFFIGKKGAKINFKSSGEQQAATKVSYFKGKDPSKWHSGIASYQSVSLGQVYPGIEVKLKASGKNIEKIFYVSPQSNVADIKIGVAGVDGLEVDSIGRLLLKNSLGELAMRAPIAWQEIAGQRREVKASYRLLGKYQYGFALSGDYDKNHTLIIDPELATMLASTFLGGSGYFGDSGHALIMDNSGNIFLTGSTYSADFPTRSGAFDRTFSGGVMADAFIAKLNNDLSELLAATFLGGNVDNTDTGLDLALDGFGHVFVTGNTGSSDFPTTPGAFDRSLDGPSDVFVAKLNLDLSVLLASTYLGGNGYDAGYALALDGQGNVFVAGNGSSTNFPVTAGAFDGSSDRLHDLFIAKLNNDLTVLSASTFLGFYVQDYEHSGNLVRSLALDNAGNVYVTGGTDSADFPTTPGAHDPTYNGFRHFFADGREHWWYYDMDVFISKLDNDLTTLLASTYLGWSEASEPHQYVSGRDEDFGHALVLDNAGHVYVAGETNSWGFPSTAGAYDETYNGGWWGDTFVAKLDDNLSTLIASSFLGGKINDSGYALALDRSGSVYVAGTTNSSDFPVTAGAYDPTLDDIFISKLDKDLTTLLGSTFLGGSKNDVCTSLITDNSGNIYLAGNTASWDFPTTSDAFSENLTGTADAFISKLGSGSSSITVTSPNGGEIWDVGTRHDITWRKWTEAIGSVRIEFSPDKGSTWKDVVASTANGGSYSWEIPDFPSRRCLIRISAADNASDCDTSNGVFIILMVLDLQAERRQAKALSIGRKYGQVSFPRGNPAAAIAEYRLMRRKGNKAFELFRTILPSELQNNQFQMQDKYLEKNTLYTYKVNAFNAAGQLVGYSLEKTI